MRIGAVELQNNVILAPMAGVTDLPFRRLCREYGAGLAVSEMVPSNAALWGTPKTVRRLDHRGEAGPIAIQILGTEPAAVAEAARVNVDAGADIIDINMGCPAKKVCKVAAGSALLRDEVRVGRILEAVVAAVEVPVTLKIRTGWAPAARNAARIASIAEAAGIACITVHGRTRACGYGVPAEYETIRSVCEQVNIPVVANGDIDSPEKAREVLRASGADGVMVGRAALGRPWLFRAFARDPGVAPSRPPAEEIAAIVLRHTEDLYAFYGTRLGVRIARKHVAWYSRGGEGASAFRERFNRAETPSEQLHLIAHFFSGDPIRRSSLYENRIGSGGRHAG